MKKRLGSILLAIAMALTILPWSILPARAEGEAQTQTAGWNGMYYVEAGDTVYLGNTVDSDGAVKGVAWRVLSLPGDDTLPVSSAGQVLLISKYTQGQSAFGSSNVWANSAAQAWCASYDASNPSGLTDAEKAAIVQTTVEEASGYSYSSYFTFASSPNRNDYGPASLNGERFFLLSAEEADKYFANDSDRAAYASEAGEESGTPLRWWLRSPFINQGEENKYAGCVRNDDAGMIDAFAFNESNGMRPAFNLRASDVIYAASANGKYLLSEEFQPPENTEEHIWKLTLLDQSRTGFSATVDRTALNAGDTVTVSYSGAVTGEHETVSALLYNGEGELLGYASRPVEALGGSTGTVTFTLPVRAGGSCTMRVFNEHRNGDYLSDYAGNVVDIALAVTAKPGASAETAYEIGGETEADAWTNLRIALSSSGTRREDGEDAGHPTCYRLTGNCTDGVASNDSYLAVGNDRSIVLDLNGNKLDRGLSKAESCLSNGQVIQVSGSASLTIMDSTATPQNPAGNGVITGGYGDYGGGIYAMYSPRLTLRGGTITGNRANSFGGGVCMSGGTLVLCGAVISQNTANYDGGGVYCAQICNACTIESGTISGNTAGRNGGGICAAGIGVRIFTINGGRISGNTAKSGGGVSADGSFTMNGGEISENEANNGNGGGVYAENGAACNGGRITSNNATGDGGGVFCNGETLTLDGCTISDNRARSGGGVYAAMFCTLTMREGSLIAGNEADAGGGMYLVSSICTITGGRITGNNVRSSNRTRGGGVYYNSGTDPESEFNVSGSPVIAGNVSGGSFTTGILAGGVRSNVYLEWDIDYNSRITVTAALTDGARIGVSGRSGAVAAAAVADYQDGKLTEADFACFMSDDPLYAFTLNGNQQAELQPAAAAIARVTVNEYGAIWATVKAPANTVLVAASYDANGRMLDVNTEFLGEEIEELKRIDVAAGARYSLMLMDGTTYAPLCEAWNGAS